MVRSTGDAELDRVIAASRVFVVGSGGIGCELLKNLVMCNFRDISTIDMDTIDVSNLNRQFLFSQGDVGKPKAQVAAATAMRFNPECTVKWFVDNVRKEEFGPDYVRDNFDLVFNALDNLVRAVACMDIVRLPLPRPPTLPPSLRTLFLSIPTPPLVVLKRGH